MKTQKVKRVISNAKFLFLLQLVNYAAPLIVLPLLTRTLKTPEFGAVMVAMAVMQICFVITDFGFSLSATQRIAHFGDNRSAINGIISNIYAAKLPLLIIAFLLVALITNFSAYTEYRFIFFAGFVGVIAQAYQPIWLFQGIQKIGLYALYMAVSKILYVVLVYIFVQNSNDGWLVLICWSSANIVATSISYIMLKKEGFEIKVPDIRSVFRELAQSSGFFWSRIAVVFYTSLGSVLVGTISLSQAAMYTSAEQIYKAGQAVTQPITQALYPYMAKEKDWKLFYGILTKALIILVIGVGIVYIGRNYLVQTAFGDGFEDAVPILSIFLMINIINFLGVNFGYPAFAAMSRTDIANNSVILGCVYFITHISVVYNLEKLSGINVAYAVLATEILVMAVRVTYFLKLKYK